MMQTELTEIHGALSVISIFEEVYVLIPLRVSGNGQQSTAVLGFAVEPGALEERFQFVSGGLAGQMTLYGEEGEILFSSQDEPCREGEKDVLTVASGDGRYRFCCRLQREPIMQGSLFFLQIVLVLSDVVLVFVIANVFAAKAYKPLQILTEKYHGKVSDKKAGHENALEELNYMMDSMLQQLKRRRSRSGFDG